MRVICIDDSPTGMTNPPLVYGHPYTISKAYRVQGQGACELVEMSDRYVFRADRFVPCSDIDETERIEEVLEQMFVKKENV